MPGENFHQFRHLLLLANFLLREFLSRVDDYPEDMMTFTALAKIYSTEYFCDTKVAGVDEIFVQRKILSYTVYYVYECLWFLLYLLLRMYYL